MINSEFLPVIGIWVATNFTIQCYFLFIRICGEDDIIWFLHKYWPIVHTFCKDQRGYTLEFPDILTYFLFFIMFVFNILVLSLCSTNISPKVSPSNYVFATNFSDLNRIFFFCIWLTAFTHMTYVMETQTFQTF